MADEENPLGGGPFGVGPFGPLVGAAAAVATVFNMVVVTTTSPAPRTLFYQAKIAPPPQPPVEVATAESFSVTTGRASSKSLFYQAKIGPPPVVAAVDNTGTFATWYVQLSRAAARPVAEPTRFTPFVPQIAPQPTAAQWLQPFKRQVAVPLPVYTQPILPYTPIVVVADVTADQWLPRWRGPPSYFPAPAGGSPFVPKEATLDNTLTGIPWLQRWQGPPSYHPAPAGGSPFVPREAVRENTVTPDKWLVRFQGAVPVPPVHHTQPVLGYPYQAASNLTTTLEWMPAWRGPPSYTPIKVQVPPFVPKADIVDQVTPDKWLQAWKGPPRAVPAQAGGSPFVPKEAVLENTVTPDKWLVRFAKAVPVPKPVPTQPVFGYPYVSQAIVVPYEQWWHQPLSRPAARPAVHNKPYQPFVPKEAVAENTQTPDKWLQRWQGPPRYKPPKIQTPPFYVVPAADNTVTIEKWQQPLSVAVRTPQARPTQPSLYLPAVVGVAEAAEAQTFSVTWAYPTRKSLFYQAKIAPQYVPVVADNTVTPDKWLKPLGIAAKRPAPRPTQPFFGYPYAAVPPPLAAESFSIGTAQTFRKSLFYQARISVQRPPIILDAIEGGPADEPERVVCILPHSRDVVVSEVSRAVVVPVDLRVATVPELSRTVEVLLSDREEDSNESTTLPCAGPIVIPPPEGEAAFQDDAFQDDGFQ